MSTFKMPFAGFVQAFIVFTRRSSIMEEHVQVDLANEDST